jgi:hypothetical protein
VLAWSDIREMPDDRKLFVVRLHEPITLAPRTGTRRVSKDRLELRLLSWSEQKTPLDLDAVRHLLVRLVEPLRHVASSR